jgi:hypothetical protein
MEPQVYAILDNGGEPFRVYVYEDEKRFVVCVQDEWPVDECGEYIDDANFEPTYTRVALESPFVQCFVGSDPDDPEFFGNSVLFQVDERAYVYVGTEIRLFRPEEPIQQYMSPVGINCAAYPFARSRNHTYLMEERVFAANEVADVGVDPYDAYYDSGNHSSEGFVESSPPVWRRFPMITLVRRDGDTDFKHLHLTLPDLLSSLWYKGLFPRDRRLALCEEEGAPVVRASACDGDADMNPPHMLVRELKGKRYRHPLRHLLRRTLLGIVAREFLKRRAAARVVLRHWRVAISDPTHAMCRRRLMREFGEMVGSVAAVR